MNIKSALKYGYISLAKSTKIPHLEAEILLAKSMSSIREFILSHSDEEIMMATQKKYLSDIKKRNSGFPLAYLTGKKEFYGLEFFVNQNVLIPRPETELIIDEVINLTYNNDYKFSIIDVGTGSGCIIITLAKLLKQNNFYGIDISNKALRVARKNAKLNKVTNIKFLRANLLQPFLNSKFKIQNSKLVIIANLPYLTAEQIKNSPSIKKEPRLALLGGKNGLRYYEKLLQQIKLLRLKNLDVLLEIDPGQKNKISSLIKKFLPAAIWQIKKDLKGHNRIVIIN